MTVSKNSDTVCDTIMTQAMSMNDSVLKQVMVANPKFEIFRNHKTIPFGFGTLKFTR